MIETLIIYLIIFFMILGVVDHLYTLDLLKLDRDTLKKYCDVNQSGYGKFFADGYLDEGQEGQKDEGHSAQPQKEKSEQQILLERLAKTEAENPSLRVGPWRSLCALLSGKPIKLGLTLTEQRLIVILRSVQKENAVRKLPTFTSLRALSLQQAYAQHAPWLRTIISFLLVLGIVGTLVGVHEALETVDLHDEKTEVGELMRHVSHALWPGMLATFFSVVLMLCRGWYRYRFNRFMKSLDNMTMALFLPSLQIQSHEGVTIDRLVKEIRDIRELDVHDDGTRVLLRENYEKAKEVFRVMEGSFMTACERLSSLGSELRLVVEAIHANKDAQLQVQPGLAALADCLSLQWYMVQRLREMTDREEPLGAVSQPPHVPRPPMQTKEMDDLRRELSKGLAKLQSAYTQFESVPGRGAAIQAALAGLSSCTLSQEEIRAEVKAINSCAEELVLRKERRPEEVAISALERLQDCAARLEVSYQALTKAEEHLNEICTRSYYMDKLEQLESPTPAHDPLPALDDLEGRPAVEMDLESYRKRRDDLVWGVRETYRSLIPYEKSMREGVRGVIRLIFGGDPDDPRTKLRLAWERLFNRLSQWWNRVVTVCRRAFFALLLLLSLGLVIKLALVGWNWLQTPPAPATEPEASLAEVEADEECERIPFPPVQPLLPRCLAMPEVTPVFAENLPVWPSWEDVAFGPLSEIVCQEECFLLPASFSSAEPSPNPKPQPAE